MQRRRSIEIKSGNPNCNTDYNMDNNLNKENRLETSIKLYR